MRLRFFALGLSLLLHGALLWYFSRSPLPARAPEVSAAPASHLAVGLVFSRPVASSETGLNSKAKTQAEPPPRPAPPPARPELPPGPAKLEKTPEAKPQIKPLSRKAPPPETRPEPKPDAPARPELPSHPPRSGKSPQARPGSGDEKHRPARANTSGLEDSGHESVNESNTSGKNPTRTTDSAAFSPAAPPSPVTPTPDRADEYRKLVLRRVEQHKRYPRLARRRGLEGELRIFLALDASGRIQALQVRGGHRLLRGAAEQAVKNALPFPPPWPGAGLPLNLNFKMIFRLQ